VLFPALQHLIYLVQKHSMTGSHLLHLLQGKATCGVPEVQSCANRLLWHCNQVLLNQLSAW
jgi:gamma-tubulin complex component 4